MRRRGVVATKAFNPAFADDTWTMSTTFRNESGSDITNVLVVELVRGHWVRPTLRSLGGDGEGELVATHYRESVPDVFKLHWPDRWEPWQYCWLRPESESDTSALHNGSSRVYRMGLHRLVGTESFTHVVFSDAEPHGREGRIYRLPPEIAVNIDPSRLVEASAGRKIQAAAYHLGVLKTFVEGNPRDTFLDGGRLLSSYLQGPHQEHFLAFLCHMEAYVMQLYAAFDVLLQHLSLARRLGHPADNITWSTMAGDGRIRQDPVFNLLENLRETRWFMDLAELRHEVVHRTTPDVEIDFDARTGDVSMVCIQIRTFIPDAFEFWLREMAQIVDRVMENLWE